jgi:hypothetical protein
MTDDPDDMEELPEDERAALDELRSMLRRDGIKAAYAALVNVCQDSKAPAPARATAAAAIFRAAGLFERTDEGAQKQLHEMTADELARHSARLEKEMKALRRRRSAAGDLFR